MSKSNTGQNKKSAGKHTGGFRKKGFNKPKKQENSAPVSKRPSNPDLVRLNKYVSNSGVCSRRDADIYISAGSVTVNGKTITEMGYKVKLTDEVKFDGRLLNPIKKEYVLLNKPKDFSTTVRDNRGKRNVSGLISNASKTPLLPIDKMDKEATGLLLFTNDGDLTKRLKSPKNGLRKIYHVVLNKDLRSADMKKIQEGITLDEKPIRVQDISFIDNAPKREVGIEIFSSKNKVVELIFEHLDYEVVKIDRVSYAGLTKKDLPRGHWRYLTDQELINLNMIK
ncbi:pseudouridine synthase [Aurantibacter sp.]|uniref:pseudouridine synthase n=1 Tax=Aurantibacter sp. TaxID=2807103 RepID=UPI003267D772